MSALKATSAVVEEKQEQPLLPQDIDAEDELDELLELLDKLKPQEVELPEERPNDLCELLQLRKVLKPQEQFLV